ncbi:chymotrypsin BII-like [Leguminivora glycinivorella]|uniref:chymotrypsin BII-like n=1 Tax=Leguminivora glycinivorella TaxID=1035111 RepID=UPI00200FC3AD|nr:chymotrypsin BII-like [Leguminivora glycinivorella]
MLHVFLLSLATGVGAKMTPFIVGGGEASIKDWQFIVFLQIDRYIFSVSCGGSLLSSQTVLTAAHCLDDYTEKKKAEYYVITAFMGHSLHEKATMKRRGLDYETHKRYSMDAPYPFNDIGILFLTKPMTFGRNIKKIILQPSFSPKVDKRFAVAGWGATIYTDDDENIVTSKRLKSVMFKSKMSENCTIGRGFVCTRLSKEYPFTGDSGGPMINAKTGLQLGIVSFRDSRTSWIFFTSVPHYWNWIKETQLKLYKKYCNKGK